MSFKEKIIEWSYSVYCELYLKPKMKRKIEKATKNMEFVKKYNSEIDYIRQNGVEFVPYAKSSNFVDNVFYDGDKCLYYANVFGKRLYFKKGIGKKQAITNMNQLLDEQGDNSPHLYISKEETFFENKDVILIDAGSAEGNFSLEYIDKCKKVYLIEADNTWNDALEATFKFDGDKVSIINTLISDTSDEKSTSLDDLFPDLKNEKVFIKMDLEGYGLKAIMGAKNILLHNDVFIANASYHYDDEYEKIKKYVESHYKDYTVDSSDGYALFWYDRNLKYPYFRKGMCRIHKDNK